MKVCGKLSPHDASYPAWLDGVEMETLPRVGEIICLGGKQYRVYLVHHLIDCPTTHGSKVYIWAMENI